MGFEVPSPFKVSPTVDEELFKKSWDVIEDEVMRMLDAGWAYSLKGKSEAAVAQYQGANIYFYFIYLAQAARMRLDLRGFLDTTCNATHIDEAYGLTCIEDNLPCLSRNFDTDYRAAWDQILSIFGIDRNTESCNDSCVGIGEMIMEGEDEDTAFIIGPCTDIERLSPNNPENFGEFTLGGFEIGGFTNFNETE
jgi:hypothetical protein